MLDTASGRIHEAMRMLEVVMERILRSHMVGLR